MIILNANLDESKFFLAIKLIQKIGRESLLGWGVAICKNEMCQIDTQHTSEYGGAQSIGMCLQAVQETDKQTDRDRTFKGSFKLRKQRNKRMQPIVSQNLKRKGYKRQRKKNQSPKGKRWSAVPLPCFDMSMLQKKKK